MDFDLLLTTFSSLFCILFFLIPTLNQIPLRTVLGFIFVLFLPGYSLVAALFPRSGELTGINRIALSLGLSVAISPLIGLALNYILFRISLIPILIALSTFTISFSIVAWVRRLKLPEEERFRVPFENLLKVNLGQSFWDKGLSIILIASIIGSSATFVYIAVTPKIGERFTEFYLLGPNGIAFDYPTNMTVGEEGKVIIGIVNHEYENFTYRLEAIFNGSLIHEEQIFLIENEKLEIQFTFKAMSKGLNHKLEFLLYKNQQREAYRRLYLWISIT